MVLKLIKKIVLNARGVKWPAGLKPVRGRTQPERWAYDWHVCFSAPARKTSPLKEILHEWAVTSCFYTPTNCKDEFEDDIGNVSGKELLNFNI